MIHEYGIDCACADQHPDPNKCRCQIIGWSRDPYESHISAQPEWEQADDCPVHPLWEAGK